MYAVLIPLIYSYTLELYNEANIDATHDLSSV